MSGQGETSGCESDVRLRVERFSACNHGDELLNSASSRICAFSGRDPVEDRVAVLVAEALEHRAAISFRPCDLLDLGRVHPAFGDRRSGIVAFRCDQALRRRRGVKRCR